MPVLDYPAYAQTPHGKAARKRAHDKYVKQRRVKQLRNLKPAALLKVISNWTSK